MRAVVHDRYGPPEVLRLADVERPVPEADEVLVQIHATTVTRTDCGWRRAEPFFSRVFTGLRNPKHEILGMEPLDRSAPQRCSWPDPSTPT